MSLVARKRLAKEVKELAQTSLSDGTLSLSPDSDSDNLENVLIDIRIVGNPLYDDSVTYRISYKPDSEYPFTAPAVTFVGPEIPMHPHIYSNGHICLNILYDGWSPVQTMTSVALSLQSMILQNTVLERPPGDEQYCSRAPANPRDSRWVFHDDNC
ncbi:hypothetical protein CANINC_003934 [Pichia inconspicua]|uniref:UBC core domain-containing protein n=1 Tax=Pichia inconspicua TaxID=52247 RepID=A0A4T0WXX5_9ASCO|nr:hypothetical protein CANINC_003934 [[Candida] inconspicua]